MSSWRESEPASWLKGVDPMDRRIGEVFLPKRNAGHGEEQAQSAGAGRRVRVAQRNPKIPMKSSPMKKRTPRET